MVTILLPLLLASTQLFAQTTGKQQKPICVGKKVGSANIALITAIEDDDCNTKTLKETFHKKGLYIEFESLRLASPGAPPDKDAKCVLAQEMKCRHTGAELGLPVPMEIIANPNNGTFREMQFDGKDVIELTDIPRCGIYESAGFKQCDLVLSPDKSRKAVDNMLFYLSYVKGGTPPKVSIFRGGKPMQLQLK